MSHPRLSPYNSRLLQTLRATGSTVAVRCARHRDLETDETSNNGTSDRRTALECLNGRGEEGLDDLDVIDHDQSVVHPPERHIAASR